MATRNIVPNNTGEGSIGTSLKKWATGVFSGAFSCGALTTTADLHLAKGKFVGFNGDSVAVTCDATTGDIGLYAAGSNRLIVSAITGNVLIGSTTAVTGAKLEVTGAISATDVINSTANIAGGLYSTISNINSTVAYVYAGQRVAANGGVSGMLTAFSSVSNNRAGEVWVSATSDNPLVLGTNDAERMRVTAAGNVLIGSTTASNGSKLEVTGSISATTNILCDLDGSDTAGNGAFFGLRNTDHSRQWFMQLSTGNNLDFHYYNGTGYSKYLTLATTGLTVTGNIGSSGGYAIQSNTWRPTTNYMYGFEYLSDTSVKLWLQGADGVDRGVTLTLA